MMGLESRCSDRDAGNAERQSKRDPRQAAIENVDSATGARPIPTATQLGTIATTAAASGGGAGNMVARSAKEEDYTREETEAHGAQVAADKRPDARARVRNVRALGTHAYLLPPRVRRARVRLARGVARAGEKACYVECA